MNGTRLLVLEARAARTALVGGDVMQEPYWSHVSTGAAKSCAVQPTDEAMRAPLYHTTPNMNVRFLALANWTILASALEFTISIAVVALGRVIGCRGKCQQHPRRRERWRGARRSAQVIDDFVL